ncbi:MAG: hypothetical protein HXY20_09865 [Acidobacteria bacterium]|nr:hypothetical protein [Acidobacteriota bacterium]
MSSRTFRIIGIAVEGIRAAGAGGIALFSYVSLFDAKYAHLGYREEVKRVFGSHPK